MKQLYISYCTEYERDELGCSQRSNGVIVSESIDKLKAYIEEFSTGSPDCFWRYSNPSAIFAEEKMWKKLAKKHETTRSGVFSFDKLPDGFFQKA